MKPPHDMSFEELKNHDLISVTVRFDVLVAKGTSILGLWTEVNSGSISFLDINGEIVARGFIGHETEKVEFEEGVK